MCVRKLFLSLLVLYAPLQASDFTISSYNCGCLSDHYDYIRAACMHKLICQRVSEEPEAMAKLEEIESTALKILFQDDAQAKLKWDREGYAALFSELTTSPHTPGSSNLKWHALSEQIVTSYKERPIVIHDDEVRAYLGDHVKDITHGKAKVLSNAWIEVTRKAMAKRIFAHELKFDIIALQEADYLDATLFPEHYDVLFASQAHSINGIAWNRKRFALAREIGSIPGRGFAVQLLDLESGKTVLVISGHLTGCNPFYVENGDSARGDRELIDLVAFSESTDADIKIIALDSNVTATHPRLRLLKDAGFTIDSNNYLEPTCTNPWQVLDTRIDWIAVQAAGISNIPVPGVGLNSYQTNISDHKPVAARVLD